MKTGGTQSAILHRLNTCTISQFCKLQPFGTSEKGDGISCCCSGGGRSSSADLSHPEQQPLVAVAGRWFPSAGLQTQTLPEHFTASSSTDHSAWSLKSCFMVLGSQEFPIGFYPTFALMAKLLSQNDAAGSILGCKLSVDVWIPSLLWGHEADERQLRPFSFLLRGQLRS